MRLPLLALLALAACSSSSKAEEDPDLEHFQAVRNQITSEYEILPAVAERIEAAPETDGTPLPESLLGRQMSAFGDVAEELSGRISGLSNALVNLRIVTQGEFLPAPYTDRRYVLRSHTRFPDRRSLTVAFPHLIGVEIEALRDPADDTYLVRTVDARFRLVPSLDRKAYRVELDEFTVKRRARGPGDALGRLDKPLRVLVAFTFRYLDDREGIPRSRVVGFQERIDARRGDFHGDRRVSDWIPLLDSDGPYSVTVRIYDFKEVSKFLKQATQASDAVSGILRSFKLIPR